MATDSKTFQTAGDLKRELANIPDDAPLSYGDGQKQATMGVSLHRSGSGSGVIFGSSQQQQQRA